MNQNIQEVQRNAIMRMLSVSQNDSGMGAQTWKVLVYDKFCQDVVAPLMKVGAIRNAGVTVNWNINSERLPVADVPAVYFLEPTEENIKRICEDLEKNLYESCYINFASAVPRPLLMDLAKGAVSASAAQKIGGVFDRYVSFVSLSPSLFSLNLPAAYQMINSPVADDNLIQQYIERIVDGILSVLITNRVLPVIRCPPGHAAEMVGRRLDERIRELLTGNANNAADLFSNTAVGSSRGSGLDGAGGASGSSQRPVICIFDRDMDLVTMLNHTWTYQAMAHDVLGMRLNRLTVPVDSSSDAAAPPKTKSYDVDETDSFWVQHASEPWTAAAEAVQQAIDDFTKKKASMSASGEDDPNASIAPGLAAAINALPEMTEKKRSIEMHTNIATALMNEVKARELHRYYELEDQFSSQSVGTSVKELDQLLSEAQKGTSLDKTRALMVFYLTKPSIPAAQLATLTDALSAANGFVSGLAYLQQLNSIQNLMVPSAITGPSPSTSTGTSFMSSLANSVRAQGEGLLAAGMANMKNIVSSKKELVICQILESVMEQKQSNLTDNYLYLDPKLPQGSSTGDAPRIRAPFRRGFAFVIGGGNYSEMQSVQEWAQAKGRQITYGSTDLVAPAQFVEELNNLGQSPEGGGSVDLS